MSENKWITSLCGKNKRFGDVPCKHYNHENKQECFLLKEKELDDFWKHCRCALELIETAEKKSREKIQMGAEACMDIKKIIEKSKNNPMSKGHNLAVWNRYVKTTVYREIKQDLIRKKIIPGKKQCGSCKWFSKTKPYMCSQTGILKKKTDKICENNYASDMFVTLVHEDHLDITYKKTKHHPSAEEEFENKQRATAIISIEHIIKSDGNHSNKDIIARRCDVWKKWVFFCYEHREEEITKKDINKMIGKMANKYGKTTKTIQNDLIEIKKIVTENYGSFP
jgi:hypothetical protein